MEKIKLWFPQQPTLINAVQYVVYNYVVCNHVVCNSYENATALFSSSVSIMPGHGF